MLIRLHNKSRKRQFGQGMTEYIIIVGLIAVAGIGTYSWFGRTIRTQTGNLAAEIAGSASQRGNVTNAARQTGARANETKSMGTYETNNNGQ